MSDPANRNLSEQHIRLLSELLKQPQPIPPQDMAAVDRTKLSTPPWMPVPTSGTRG